MGVKKPTWGYVIIGPTGIVWPHNVLCDDLITAQIALNGLTTTRGILYFIAKCMQKRMDDGRWSYAGSGFKIIKQ